MTDIDLLFQLCVVFCEYQASVECTWRHQRRQL